MTPQNSLADQIEKTGHALTANELAGILNLSTKTIFKMVKSGRIPAIRIGVSVRFDCFAVAGWLRQRACQT
jgi:excisionase family DNA binding protein